jgi:hypothetical protein
VLGLALDMELVMAAILMCPVLRFMAEISQHGDQGVLELDLVLGFFTMVILMFVASLFPEEISLGKETMAPDLDLDLATLAIRSFPALRFTVGALPPMDRLALALVQDMQPVTVALLSFPFLRFAVEPSVRWDQMGLALDLDIATVGRQVLLASRFGEGI